MGQHLGGTSPYADDPISHSRSEIILIDKPVQRRKLKEVKKTRVLLRSPIAKFFIHP